MHDNSDDDYKHKTTSESDQTEGSDYQTDGSFFHPDSDDSIDNENNNLQVATLERNTAFKLRTSPKIRQKYKPLGQGQMINNILKAKERRKNVWSINF